MSQVQLRSIDFAARLARDAHTLKKQNDDVTQHSLCLPRTAQALGQTDQHHPGIEGDRFGGVPQGSTVRTIEFTRT